MQQRHYELSKYFTEEDNKDSISEIRETKNDLDFLRKMDAYESMLKMGKLVWIVYSYKKNCISSTKAELVMVAYYGSKFDIEDMAVPTKVIVDYIKEASGWKIKLHTFDTRSKTRNQLSTGVPIDNFAWK